MTSRDVGALATRVLGHALAATCGCAMRRWNIDVGRTFAGVTVRAEVRSQ